MTAIATTVQGAAHQGSLQTKEKPLVLVVHVGKAPASITAYTDSDETAGTFRDAGFRSYATYVNPDMIGNESALCKIAAASPAAVVIHRSGEAETTRLVAQLKDILPDGTPIVVDNDHWKTIFDGDTLCHKGGGNAGLHTTACGHIANYLRERLIDGQSHADVYGKQRLVEYQRYR